MVHRERCVNGSKPVTLCVQKLELSTGFRRTVADLHEKSAVAHGVYCLYQYRNELNVAIDYPVGSTDRLSLIPGELPLAVAQADAPQRISSHGEVNE